MVPPACTPSVPVYRPTGLLWFRGHSTMWGWAPENCPSQPWLKSERSHRQVTQSPEASTTQQQMRFKALISTYILNLTISLHLYHHHPGPGYLHLSPGILQILPIGLPASTIVLLLFFFFCFKHPLKDIVSLFCAKSSNGFLSPEEYNSKFSSGRGSFSNFIPDDSSAPSLCSSHPGLLIFNNDSVSFLSFSLVWSSLRFSPGSLVSLYSALRPQCGLPCQLVLNWNPVLSNYPYPDFFFFTALSTTRH